MRFLTNHKKIALLIATILCVITILLTLNFRQPLFLTNLTSYIIIPTQNITTSIGNWVSDRINFFNNFRQIELDNIELQMEVEYLRGEYLRMELLERDNIALRELFEMDQRYPKFSTVGAEIVARDSNNWNTSFIINKGLNHGLTPNMVILAHGGLVGRIVHSGAKFSRVVPIIDDRSSVGAVTMRSGDFGFVRGDLTLSNSGLAKMDLLEADSEILEGDEIITSSLGLIYPDGLLIGRVKEVYNDPSTLTRVAIIEPTVDFNKITTVLVIDEVFDIDFEE